MRSAGGYLASVLIAPLLCACFGSGESAFGARLVGAGVTSIPSGADVPNVVDIDVATGEVVEVPSVAWEAVSPDPASSVLTVLWTEAEPGACGLHVTSARLEESSGAVVVQLLAEVIPPAVGTTVCAGVGYGKQAPIELSGPLGARMIQRIQIGDVNLPLAN